MGQESVHRVHEHEEELGILERRIAPLTIQAVQSQQRCKPRTCA